MDDLNCCLSQIVHLCNEASIFLNQLYKFENQFDTFHCATKVSSKRYFSILHRFSLIIDDFNLYYRQDFSRFYLRICHFLSRKSFTVNYSNEIIEDFYEDIQRLNTFLNRKDKAYYRNIFYYLHKLTTTCALCLHYRQTCTEMELANRFVYIRMDLLINLDRLNEEIRWLLMKISSDFQQRTDFVRKRSREKIEITNLSRTIFLWLILLLTVSFLLWTTLNDNQHKIS